MLLGGVGDAGSPGAPASHPRRESRTETAALREVHSEKKAGHMDSDLILIRKSPMRQSTHQDDLMVVNEQPRRYASAFPSRRSAERGSRQQRRPTRETRETADRNVPEASDRSRAMLRLT